MNINTGMAVVIVAVLIFYLRLIIIQRERAKRLQRSAVAEQPGNVRKRKKNSAALQTTSVSKYSIISENRLDRWIGLSGGVLIILGVVINLGLLPPPGTTFYDVIQPLWWIPTALGIIAFSWMFKL
jgi:hypothetical protein